jgi:hypothetical protein
MLTDGRIALLVLLVLTLRRMIVLSRMMGHLVGRVGIQRGGRSMLGANDIIAHQCEVEHEEHRKKAEGAPHTFVV